MPIIIGLWIAIAIIYIGYHLEYYQHLARWQVAVRVLAVIFFLPVVLLIHFGMWIKEIN